jgi:hypothetical protein
MIWSYPLVLEGELDAEADDRLVVVAVAENVPGTISEDAHAACGRDAEVKTTTDEEVAAGVGVGGETAANHGVRGQAKAGDGVAQDQCGIKLVMFAFGCVETIGALKGDVGGEGVLSENTTTQLILFTKNCTTEGTQHEARSEALTAGWGWRWHHRSLWVFVGYWASEDSTAKCNCGEEGHE